MRAASSSADGLRATDRMALLSLALATVARNTIITAITPRDPITVVTRPNPVQQKAFDLPGAECSRQRAAWTAHYII